VSSERARLYISHLRKKKHTHENCLSSSVLYILSIKNSCIVSYRTHIYSKRNLMAASTTSLSSRGFSSAQFVAGSRRPVKSSSRGRFVSRASSSGKKEEVLCGENADESSTNIAGKAVSAVVAAAISLSSAGQAAVAQVVRFFVCSRSPRFLFASFDSNTANNKKSAMIRYRKALSSVLDRVFRINWKVCVLSFLF